MAKTNGTAAPSLADLQARRAALADDLAALRPWAWRDRAALEDSIRQLDHEIDDLRAKLREQQQAAQESQQQAAIAAAQEREAGALGDVKAAVAALMAAIEGLDQASQAVIAAGGWAAPSGCADVYRSCKSLQQAWQLADPEYWQQSRAADLQALRDQVDVWRSRLRDAQAMDGGRIRDMAIERALRAIWSSERAVAWSEGRPYAERSEDTERDAILQARAGGARSYPSISELEDKLRNAAGRVARLGR